MSKWNLLPTRTPGRLAWLRQLATGNQARTGHGSAPNHCLRLGWTTWNKTTGHMLLTDGGRAVLDMGAV